MSFDTQKTINRLLDIQKELKKLAEEYKEGVDELDDHDEWTKKNGRKLGGVIIGLTGPVELDEEENGSVCTSGIGMIVSNGRCNEHLFELIYEMINKKGGSLGRQKNELEEKADQTLAAIRRMRKMAEDPSEEEMLDDMERVVKSVTKRVNKLVA